MRWIKASERLPDNNGSYFTKWINGEHITREILWWDGSPETKLYWDGNIHEWLSESSSPSPLKDVIEEMEKDLEHLGTLDERTNAYVFGQSSVLSHYLPKLKQIGEGSDDSIVNELNHIKRTCEGFEYVPSQTIIEMIDRILNKQ